MKNYKLKIFLQRRKYIQNFIKSIRNSSNFNATFIKFQTAARAKNATTTRYAKAAARRRRNASVPKDAKRER